MSLLDLVIALAIAAILLGVAVPSYHRHLERTDRADAIRRLLAAAGCQERVRASAGHYDTTRCADGGGDAYTIRFIPPDEPETLTFSVIATPSDPDSSDSCGSLQLDQSGHRSISGPDGSLAACWGGR
ncbi:MAG: type IV pilin protein [Lysobacterales bacterium]|jgi:type IV pilus assembly protein PilE